MIPKPKRRPKKRHNTKQYAKEYCEYCDSTNILDVHHVQSKGMGGSSNPAIHHPDNLITLCRYCHDAAHRKIKGYYISPDQLKRAKEGNNGTDYDS